MRRGASLPGEFDLIARHLAPLAQEERGAFSLQDDAALLLPRPGSGMVVTTDTIVEGVHFLKGDPAESVARKALRVNLSDLAAKAARPRWYLMATSWPAWVNEAWVESFASGLAQDQVQFGIRLVGGDTTRTPGPLSVSITAIGEARGRRMIRRAGARAGDDVWVTGTIGDAYLGLQVARGGLDSLEPGHRAALLERYRVPQPRVSAGMGLALLARAAIDVSDGLCADLGHVAKTSGISIELHLPHVPLSVPAHQAVLNGSAKLEDLLAGGDDYEIAFTAPPSARVRVLSLGRRLGLRLTRIGACRRGAPVVMVTDGQGKAVPVSKAGFTHF
jgi:thiamine-monophosphate kinase